MTKWQVIYEINGRQQKPLVFDDEKEAKQRAHLINQFGDKAEVQAVEDDKFSKRVRENLKMLERYQRVSKHD